jgi:spermidine synthase
VSYEYLGEGRSSSVAVTTDQENGMRSMHVGGKIVSSTRLADARLNRMLGHLPALFHRAPKSVLVVGFGAGMTAGTFVAYPEIERIVICEIEPRVTEAGGQYFSTENYDVLNDPRTEVIYDDARHFIATTDETFDIITSDPIHPWVRGAAALYSTEYYELVKRRLNPGGIVAQWVPLYDTDLSAVKSQIGTFMRSFPQGTVWSSATARNLTVGYDVVLLGQKGPLSIDVVELTYRLGENPWVRRSLAAVNFETLPSLLSAYAGQGPELAGWLRDAQINHDRSLRLQYLAGLALAGGRDETNAIYSQILARRTYPYRLFVAPAELEGLLRADF